MMYFLFSTTRRQHDTFHVTGDPTCTQPSIISSFSVFDLQKGQTHKKVQTQTKNERQIIFYFNISILFLSLSFHPLIFLLFSKRQTDDTILPPTKSDQISLVKLLHKVVMCNYFLLSDSRMKQKQRKTTEIKPRICLTLKVSNKLKVSF